MSSDTKFLLLFLLVVLCWLGQIPLTDRTGTWPDWPPGSATTRCFMITGGLLY